MKNVGRGLINGMPVRYTARQAKQEQDSYRDFNAAELYCPKCGRAMPVREKLLLILAEGDLYDYTCTGCGTSVGSKTAR